MKQIIFYNPEDLLSEIRETSVDGDVIRLQVNNITDTKVSISITAISKDTLFIFKMVFFGAKKSTRINEIKQAIQDGASRMELKIRPGVISNRPEQPEYEF